ncbi:TrbG/VirB9 family P-type conjugative transfer protein [Erythrobacter sp. W53]|uniref:TrbG/VirB9 family P-type conjugative transfer protein n=1 Tax=Erythrobacter sp. W53 TaxID=3425947 RepID=UPI003D7685E6
MTRAAFSALALAPAILLAATPIAAQDSRLVEIPYDPARVILVEGRVKVQATIRFEDSERIENVAIGDSQAWQVTPNKQANLLFVKPLKTRAATNMTVVTSKRTYLFDLVASPSAKPVYVINFSYPDEPLEPMFADARTDTEKEAANDPRAVLDPAALNFAWATDGEKDLLPARVFDDGEATFMTWPAGEPIPAILVTDAEGVEGPVNFVVRGDTIVVEGVPRQIILRSGKESAALINNGPIRARAVESGDGSLAAAEVQQ